MKISLITPTADQPTGIALCERWIARQTRQPDEWIIADDGNVSAALTMRQTHLRRKREHEGGRSLAGNVLAALERVTGDIVVIVEHDDWYAANHIQTCVDKLQVHVAVGSQWQRYYNVHHRMWILMRNVGSALCNTAFRADLIPQMQKAAQSAFERKTYGIDRLFWESLPENAKGIHEVNTVVGIKGLPGRAGLGMGHRPDNRRPWKKDPNFLQLKKWIADDLMYYRNIG